MSTVFLFGAGASFGSGSCSPEPPPLGNGENGLFNKLAKLDGVVTDIDLKKPELRKYFINNFEEGMESFDEERKGDIADFLREMAGFFLQFEPREDNLYVRLIDKIRKKLKRVTFVTTNYDCLIERASLVLKIPYQYSYDSKNYDKNLRILKIHGSPNFIFDNKNNLSLRNLKFESKSVHVEGPCKAVNIDEAKCFLKNENSLAPAIAIYGPTKQVRYFKKYVDMQQKQWRKALSNATRCFIIGLKVHPIDEHIWGALAKASCKKYYVGGDVDLYEQWCQSNNLSRSILGETFSDSFNEIIKKLRL